MSATLSLLDGLLARVPAMRTAGVLSFSIGDVSMTLADAPPAFDESADTKTDEEPPPSDPLSNPLAYGMAPGSKVPGFERPDPLLMPDQGDDE